jgi:hypothetical protein
MESRHSTPLCCDKSRPENESLMSLPSSRRKSIETTNTTGQTKNKVEETVVVKSAQSTPTYVPHRYEPGLHS